MSDTFFIKDFVDSKFSSGEAINHETISLEFLQRVNEMEEERFEKLLAISGFIPDLYPKDSSQETLFSKLIECLIYEWARRMGFAAEIIKQKASYEDIKIIINGSIIVCDAKSFRLGRSQAAPNAKDFLKLEDVHKWMERYPSSIGGLVTFPCKHEWTGKSDIYQYCSTKRTPTLMLPYKYLSFLLHAKTSFVPDSFLELWNYDRIFPKRLSKNMPGGNKTAYWNKIDKEILDLTKYSKKDFQEYLKNADQLINGCVLENERFLRNKRAEIISTIKDRIAKENDVAKVKKELMDYMIRKETSEIDQMLERITNFRK